MFTIGEAKVFLDRSCIDSETIKQIERISCHPTVHHPRIMPDCHKGNGCCVGFTSELGTAILPGLIGGDIGCGICLYPISKAILSKKNSLEKINKIIRLNIPMGNGFDKVHELEIISIEQYSAFFEDAQLEALQFCEKYEEKFQESIRDFMPVYGIEWLRELCSRVESNFDYDLRCMGTLGGGNHFVEVDEKPDGNAFLAVHTGSRNIGHKIAEYHSKRLIDSIAAAEVPCDPVDSVCNASNSSNCRDEIADDVETRDLVLDPSIIGLTGRNAALYYFDMIWAQTWAKMNRRCIISAILMGLNITFSSSELIESVHNYIDFRDMIIRKGAISAREGESCVIALNMRDGLLICSGKGNPDWNYSAPHGCGRIVSRKSAGSQVNNVYF